MPAIIGSLRAELSATIAQFQSDLGKAAESVEKFGRRARQVTRDLEAAGRDMSVAVTAPIVAFGVESIKAAAQVKDAAAQVTSALQSMGNHSGRTLAQLQKQAEDLRDSSLFDDDDILRKVTANLVTFGNVSGPIFDQAQQAVVNMATRLNEDLQPATIRIGRALNDPIKGVTALQRVGVAFTEDQKKQITQLVRTGHAYEAQAVILKELNREFGGAAKASLDASPTGALLHSWDQLKEVVGAILLEYLPPFVNFLKGMAEAFDNLSPKTQHFIVVAAGIAALVGPVLLLVGTLGRLTVAVTTVFGPVISIAIVGIRNLGIALATLAANPVFWAITALAALAAGIAYVAWTLNTMPAPSRAATRVTDDLRKASDDYAAAAGRAANATGEERVQLLQAAGAKKAAAELSLRQARASLDAAEASLKQAEADAALAGQLNDTGGDGGLDVLAIATSERRKHILADIGAIRAGMQRTAQSIADSQGIIDAATRRPPAALLPPNFNTGTGGGASAADAEAKRLKAATDRYAEQIRDMNDEVTKGFETLAQPRSMVAAEALRRKIADIGQDATQSGVNLSEFAGEIAFLQGQIDQLEIAGLQKEAEAFAKTVATDTRAVNEFARGGLPPLEDALQAVDDKYNALRDQILAEIDANEQLAAANDAAAAAMATLRAQLTALEDAHKKATDAARSQYEAEKHIADLQAAQQNADTLGQIADLHAARGDTGVMGKHAQDMQAIERDLQRQRMSAATHLAELQAEYDRAKALGDADAMARLTTEIDLQTQLYNLVADTTATQVDQAQTLQDAITTFADGLSQELQNTVANWKVDLSSVANLFKQLVNNLLVAPLMNRASDALGKGLGALATKYLPHFAGGGSFTVGGPGSTGGFGVDTHLVQFMARTGENVAVTQPGGGSGDSYDAGSQALSVTIDARGAGPREIDQLKAVIEDLKSTFKPRVWAATNEGIQRKKIAAPSFT